MRRILSARPGEAVLYAIMVLFPLMIATAIFLRNIQLQVLSYLLSLSLPFIFLLLFRLKLLVFLAVFSIPLSMRLTVGGGVDASLPAELLAGSIALFYVIYRLVSSNGKETTILRHPLTILVLLDITWLFITTLFSEMPLISLKRVIVRLVFLIVFFFLFMQLFKDHRNIVRVWIIYAVGLVIPILSTLYNHSHYEFAKAVSFAMTPPFFNDHTQYATCIAYVIPVLVLVIWLPEKFGMKKKMRLLLIPLAALLLTGEYFSFSRAAWLSIMIAFVFTVLVVFARFRLWHFMLVTVIAGGIIYHYRGDIYQYVEKVDSVSRAKDVGEHMESVINIQTDASNLERINRWQCALRMFRDRPLTGFGPGTYQFVYGKYQVTSEMTRISTNHGDKGNAHSEYLTYLSETGLPGFLIFNLLILYTIYVGIRIFRSGKPREPRWLALAILMGFVSYFAHGLFNSFLDTDKASVLVYGSIAALISLDVRREK